MNMSESTMPIEVHADLAKSFPKEYIEAVITDAINILPSYQHRQDTIVVINPRRVAVVLDKQAHRGAVIPVDLIEQVVERQMKSKLQVWPVAPATPVFTMPIEGSWMA